MTTDREAAYWRVNTAIAEILTKHGYTEAARDETLRNDLQAAVVVEVGNYLRRTFDK